MYEEEPFYFAGNHKFPRSIRNGLINKFALLYTCDVRCFKADIARVIRRATLHFREFACTLGRAHSSNAMPGQL